MAARRQTGAETLCRALESAGVETVFGLPGSQNLEVFEALRHAKIATILTSHELGAAFMANGYARVSGRPGVLLTIPGPGFTYALTGLAEARLDSAPVVHLVPGPARGGGIGFPLQAIDQTAMAGPVCKSVLEVRTGNQLASTIRRALRVAVADEPGPVLVQIEPDLLAELVQPTDEPDDEPGLPEDPNPDLVRQMTSLIRGSTRCVIYAGQGATPAAEQVRILAERLGAPVIATTSGRGILPEDHPLGRSFDFGSSAAGAINEVFHRADLILVLGCKFSHNGAHGFRLVLPPEKLVQIDASAATLAASFPGHLACRAEVGRALGAILQGLAATPPLPPDWAPGEVESIWRAARVSFAREAVEPRMRGLSARTPEAFFAALGRAMPEGGCLVTDSGLHQMLARRHYTVRWPRGLIVPTNFQSMGFAIPAAIGARLGAPNRAVVALIGDGGLLMSGLELLSGVRQRIPLTVLVFNDGHLGLIRLQQLSTYGHAFRTEVLGPDLEALALAVGASYRLLEGDSEVGLREAFASPGVNIVEIEVGEGGAIRRAHARGLVRSLARRLRRRFRP